LRCIITSRRGPVEPPQREVDATDDNREHIVEVVRDAPCQLADGLHLLDLAELRFGGLAIGSLGLQGLVRFPQLLSAVANCDFERFGALRLTLGRSAGLRILAQCLDRNHAEEDGTEAYDDSEEAEVVGELVGLCCEQLALLEAGAQRRPLADDDLVQLVVERLAGA
jgi:hypothetical protein